MRVSGFTVIRNALVMGYPVLESIRSVLPLTDEFIVGVGQSQDGTRELIESINDPRIKVFDSHWDTGNTSGGLILSEKTNEALAKCSGDWWFYIQADEVVHENDHEQIKQSMEKHLRNENVEGLLFKYQHFYGAYDIVATARNWYRNEVRVVKNGKKVLSIGDAQGFRVRSQNGELRKPRVVQSGASIFHYGWVKPPQKMGEKNKHMFRWWHGNKYDEAFNNFSYSSNYGLRPFIGSHPAVMKDLVAKQNWTFEPIRGLKAMFGWTRRDYKNISSDWFEKLTGYRLGEFKNYTLLK